MPTKHKRPAPKAPVTQAVDPIRRQVPPLSTRNAPSLQTREITARSITLRAASADEATRSVEVIMATDAPVTVWDWERGAIDEVLVARGGIFPEQLPLLANHSRWSLDDVLGSVRSPRQDGSRWLGRAFFADKDDEAERAWNKVRQGHLRDVSIGYRAVDYEDIPPNTSRTVDGKEYTARDRWLRITRTWEAKELSVVPIGADERAKVRAGERPRSNRSNRPVNSGRKGHTMDPALRKYLESLGLRRDASEAEARAFLGKLRGKQKARAAQIEARTRALAQSAREDANPDDQDPLEDELDELDAGREDEDTEDDEEREDVDEDDDTLEGSDGERRQRSRRSAPRRPLRRSVPAVPASRRARERETGARAERDRILGINDAARGLNIPATLIERAVEGGWSVRRAAAAFLDQIRESRGTPVGTENGHTPRGSAPNLEVGADHQRDAALQRISMGLMARSGINVQRYAERNRIQDWQALVAQADQQFGRVNRMIDFCRAALDASGQRWDYDDARTIRAAVSGGELSSIFTTSVNASILQAWEEYGDTTMGWVEEEDVADFKLQTVIDFNMSAGLEKLPRGKSANHASAEDTELTYKIARYAKQFVIDEQDIIDDNFAVLQRTPNEMGIAARRLRPDLVYYILLANASILGGDLFNATALTTAGGHKNLTTAVLGSTGLKAAIAQMGQQYIMEGKKKKVLNITPSFLIVPQALKFTAYELVQSTGIVIAGTAGTVTERGTKNVLENIVEPRVDERIGATGVTDPDSGATATGLDTNYFLASRPGRTIKCAYRRGTGRMPQIRPFVLDKGQWGVGWDVNMDIGAKAVDFRGLHKSAGTG